MRRLPPDLRLWVSVEWRSRWKAYLALGVVTAAIVAIVLSTLTAAARAGTAYERLRSATNATEARALSDDDDIDVVGWANELAQNPAVVDTFVEAEMFVRPKGSEYFPSYTLFAKGPWPEQPARDDGAARVGYNRPVIVAGREVDESAAHEVVLSEAFANAVGVGVGDTLQVESMTESWIEVAYTGGDPGPPDGPVVDLTVVGLGRTTADFGRWQGVMHLSPAFVAQYSDQILTYRRVEMVLTPEAVDGALTGTPPDIGYEAEFSPYFDEQASEGALVAIVTALRLVALAAALAGAAALTIAIARFVGNAVRHRLILSTLGWTRRRHVHAVALALAPTLALGTLLGIAAGLLLSPEMLVGLAGGMDPTPDDVRVDAGSLALVGALAVIGLTVAVILSLRIAMSRREERIASRPRGLQLQPPLPVMLGIRHALFGRAERGGRASRGALVSAVIAVGAAVAALVVASSIQLLQDDPNLTGQGVGRLIDSGEATDVQQLALTALDTDARVELLAAIDITFSVTVDGNDSTALIYDVRRGRFAPSLTSGRVALQPDEVLLGPATADSLGVGIGELVEISGPGGTNQFELVGTVLFPEGDFEHDKGIAMPRVAADRIIGDFAEATEIHSVVFEWRDGVDVAAADQALVDQGFPVQAEATAAVPGIVTNLGQVGDLPSWFAVFVGTLAAVSLAHALALAIRLRKSELGTLRALGMTGRSGAAVFSVHAATIAAVALIVGTPIGLALGSQIWRVIASRAHVVVAVAWPWEAIGAIVLLTAALLVLLSAVTAWRAIRMRPAEHLRTN